ncbi:MAG: cell division protein ZapD [Burkholderiales bacterium]|nr:cell division protein ZapD [Burkholderiales bacterium]
MPSPANSNLIGYEYPLSERVRTLLRLEDLYRKAWFFTAKAEPVENHVALVLLFDILEVAGRADLKSDLLQELERQRQSLETLRDNPAISVAALDNVVREIDQTSSRLFQMSGKFGQDLRENEWLMSIKQRTSIPGGVCEFDLPSYHYWLHRGAEQRRRDIEAWLAPFQPIHDAISIVLRLLRESGKTTAQLAPQGVFQQMMAGRVAQMLRVQLAREYACVPEMSANKYALNIRFMTLSGPGKERPRTVDIDVPFQLTFCNL